MRIFAVAMSILALALAGCGGPVSTAPVPQPDTTMFGRVAEIKEIDPGRTWEVEIRAGLPEAMQAAMRREGRPVPELERDLSVKVRVTRDAVAVRGLATADLAEFRVGEEVAVVPVPGTSAMVGTKLLQAEAAELYLFQTYQVRHLPASLESIPEEVWGSRDPERINSGGIERTPLLVGDGSVLYFAAGLLPPLKEGDGPAGSVRPGMRDAAGELLPWTVGGYRPYRTAFTGGRWSAPQPVVLPGLGEMDSARFTWVNAAETEGLVEMEGEEERILLRAHRARPGAAWALERVDLQPGGEGVGDAQFFTMQGQRAAVWTVYEWRDSDLWLQAPGAEGQPLEPRINTMGREWAPRVGPNTVLYFCRSDRQLLFAGGLVQEVRLPGVQRRPLLEAAPTADGSHLVFRVPRFNPGVSGWDLAVAAWDGDAWGVPVLMDDWIPSAR